MSEERHDDDDDSVLSNVTPATMFQTPVGEEAQEEDIDSWERKKEQESHRWDEQGTNGYEL